MIARNDLHRHFGPFGAAPSAIVIDRRNGDGHTGPPRIAAEANDGPFTVIESGDA